jgi:hypothetical protein
MKPKGRNIGKGMTILRRFNRSENEIFDDLAAFYAPSECYGAVRESIERDFREVKRHIKAVTGLKFKEFEKEVKRRTSPHWLYKNA